MTVNEQTMARVAKVLVEKLGGETEVKTSADEYDAETLASMRRPRVRLELSQEMGLGIDFLDKDGKSGMMSAATVQIFQIGAAREEAKPPKAPDTPDTPRAVKAPDEEDAEKSRKMLDKAKKILERYEQAYADYLAGMKDAAFGKNSVSQWLRWKAYGLASAELATAKWGRIVQSIERKIAEGATSEDIAKHLVGLRDVVVEQVLGWKQGCSQSSNPMSNLLDDIELGVLQSVAGNDCMGRDSLREVTGKVKDK